MAHDREVGGIRCLEVLAHLSDYLEGDADEALAARISRHLQGCDWCEQFGGRFSQTVTDLRRLLGPGEAVPDALQGRLMARLAAAEGEEP